MVSYIWAWCWYGNNAGGDVTRGGAIRGPGDGTGMTWWCYGDWASGDVTGHRG